MGEGGLGLRAAGKRQLGTGLARGWGWFERLSEAWMPKFSGAWRRLKRPLKPTPPP
jgi:hypothetical protein